MRDMLGRTHITRVVGTEAKARSLHALGAFYLRQGFPKQGLSLLLAARDYGVDDGALDRAIAQAYLLSGAPKQALKILDDIDDSLVNQRLRDSAGILRSRALLALGRVEEARAIFAMTAEPGERA